MALSIPGTSAIIEQVHGLPEGTLERVGGEAAAQLALGVQRGELEPFTLKPIPQDADA